MCDASGWNFITDLLSLLPPPCFSRGMLWPQADDCRVIVMPIPLWFDMDAEIECCQ
jgi:hypothetical protein